MSADLGKDGAVPQAQYERDPLHSYGMTVFVGFVSSPSVVARASVLPVFLVIVGNLAFLEGERNSVLVRQCRCRNTASLQRLRAAPRSARSRGSEHSCPGVLANRCLPRSGTTATRLRGASSSASPAATATFDTNRKATGGLPGHKTPSDPHMCTRNLQNLLECHKILELRGRQNLWATRCSAKLRTRDLPAYSVPRGLHEKL